ncbi:cytochrome b [Acidiphilium sp.]|jgi:cytochrome b561|uniref:cytochrome b n=1 Tax=Acidiphilium sp. TaxID=527 RepID=UPI00258FD310|nr:cytochrome b/b6 domain-containing protein [Acidiphilium sp.]
MTASPRHVYDRASLAFHWLTAILVGLNWALAEGRGFLPKGDARALVLSVHIATGFAIAAILLLRLAWCLTLGHKPPRLPGVLEAIGRLAHVLLYLLLALTVATGISRALGHGSRLFAWRLDVPMPAPLHAFLRAAGSIHGTIADALVILAGLHALAAIAHHALLRDDTLNRMLPLIGDRLRAPRPWTRHTERLLRRLGIHPTRAD